jgi:predicted ester cyclase
MSTVEERNKALIRRMVAEAINNNKLELADEAFTPDYEVHVPNVQGEVPRGPAAFKRIHGTWHTAFPDYHMEIQELVAEGDLIVNRFFTTGTFQAPLWGIPPSGKKFAVHGMVMHRIVDGKIKESWLADDIPSMLKQLGVLVPAGGRGA